MAIHFIASKSHTKYELRYYREILRLVQDAGHTIAYDWVEETHMLVKQEKIDPELWQKIDMANEQAIKQADVVIVEVTAKSFFAGVQTAQASYLKKPILMLTRDESPLSVSGLTALSGFIKSKEYTAKTLPSILNSFLEENDISTKDLRFNFFLDRQTFNYLRWMSSKTGKTKAQIVRSLLQKEMNKDD